MPKSFFDTLVLFYACDATDAAKQSTARASLVAAATSGDGMVSVAVLGEFFTATVLGRNKCLTAEEAEQYINDYAANLKVVPVEWELVPKAIAIHRNYQKSYYDSLHLAAAAHYGCAELLSEDIGFDGEVIQGVTVRNPFKAAP